MTTFLPWAFGPLVGPVQLVTGAVTVAIYSLAFFMNASSSARAAARFNPTSAVEASRPVAMKRNLNICFPPVDELASPRARQAGYSGASAATRSAADADGERLARSQARHDFSLTRIFRDARWPHHGASPLCEGGERNGDDQCRTVEERLDEERPAQLLDAGNADGQGQHAEYRAPDVDAARLDRGRAEKGADQRGQEIIEPDVRLADPQFGGEDATGKAGDGA